MPGQKYTFEDRVQQLQDFEAEHGHLFVPQKFPKEGLGRWVNNVKLRRKRGEVKADKIAELDKIGFVWVAPRGPEKDAFIEWGKQFRWLVNFQKAKGHCNVPAKIGGKEVPAAEWCDEQRQLHMNNMLDQAKVDRLSGIGFDFFGCSTEENDGEEPPVKRQRGSKDDENEALKKEIEELRKENQTLRKQNKDLTKQLEL